MAMRAQKQYLRKVEADALYRDVKLVLRHGKTLPLLLGSFEWFTVQRWSFSRPFSELSIRCYPLEYARIILQGVLTFPCALLILFALLLSLSIYPLYSRTGISIFAQPLNVVILILKHLLSQSYFRIPSPDGEPPIHTNKNIHGSGNLIKSNPEDRSALVPKRTLVAVPADPSQLQEVFYYINGIVEQGAMVQGTALLLYRLTGRMCNVFVNPSQGMGIDLLECILDRTLNICAAPCSDIVAVIVEQLARGRKVVLIAHSQGGIILASVIKLLIHLAQQERGNDEEGRRLNLAFHDDFRRLEAYSFCSAADESPSWRGGPFTEHFATENDFVARIGTLTFSGTLKLENGNKPPESLAEWNGRMYMLPKSHPCNGHLMKEMVLPALIEGSFGHESEFWRRYCDRTSSSTNYTAIRCHLVEQEK